MLAACTCTASNEQSVPVTMCRFRPFTFLPAPNPHGPPLSVVFTLWLSIIPAEGQRLRPAARRALDQDTIYVPPHVAITPIVKVMLDRGERRKVFRQSTPLAAGRKHIENAIQDDAKGPGWRAAKVAPFGKSRLNSSHSLTVVSLA